jgi:hypothetical protein
MRGPLDSGTPGLALGWAARKRSNSCSNSSGGCSLRRARGGHMEGVFVVREAKVQRRSL